MNYADYTPILFLPAAVAAGRPAVALVSLEGFAGVPFARLAVLISGSAVRAAEVSVPPAEARVDGGTLEVQVELVITEAGEQEIAIRVSVTGADPAEASAAASSEEWRTEIKRTVSVVGGGMVERPESSVLAEFAKIPGLGSAAEQPTLDQALEHVREKFSWSVRMPRFHSLAPKKRPVRPAPAEPSHPLPPRTPSTKPRQPPAGKPSVRLLEVPPTPIDDEAFPLTSSLSSAVEESLSEKCSESPPDSPSPSSRRRQKQGELKSKLLNARPTHFPNPSHEIPPPLEGPLSSDDLRPPLDSAPPPQREPRGSTAGYADPPARRRRTSLRRWVWPLLGVALFVAAVWGTVLFCLAKIHDSAAPVVKPAEHPDLHPTPPPAISPNVPSKTPATPPPTVIATPISDDQKKPRSSPQTRPEAPISLPPTPTPRFVPLTLISPVKTPSTPSGSREMERLSFFWRGGFLASDGVDDRGKVTFAKQANLDAEKSKQLDDVRSALANFPDLKSTALEIIQSHDLENVSNAGEVEATVLLGAQLKTRMTEMVAKMEAAVVSGPDGRQNQLENSKQFNERLSQVVRKAFWKSGQSFVANPALRPSIAKKTSVALRKINSLYEDTEQLPVACRKAWSDGVTMAALPSDGSPPDVEKLKALLKDLPSEFSETRSTIATLTGLDLSAKPAPAVPPTKAAALKKITEILFVPIRGPKSAPSDSRASISTLLAGFPDIQGWKDLFDAILDCQAKLDTRKYSEALYAFDKIKKFSVADPSLDSKVAEDILSGLRARVTQKMVQAVGPIILGSQFPMESDCCPSAYSDAERKEAILAFQKLVTKLANKTDSPIELAPNWSLAWSTDGRYGRSAKNAVLSAEKACFPTDPARWDGKITPKLIAELERRTQSP